MNIDNAEFMDEFMEDMIKHLKMMSDVLIKFKNSSYSSEAELLNEIFRAAHSIKGMAAAMEFKNMEKLTHKMEDVLYEMRDGHILVSEEILELLSTGYNYLTEMLDSVESSGDDDGVSEENIGTLIKKLEKYGGNKNLNEEKILEVKEVEKKVSEEEIRKSEEIFGVVEEGLKAGEDIFGAQVTISQDCPFKTIRALIVIKEIAEKCRYIYSDPDIKLLEKGTAFMNEPYFRVLISSEKSEAEIEKMIKSNAEIEGVIILEIKSKKEYEEFMYGEIKTSMEEIKIEELQDNKEFLNEILEEISIKLDNIENEILKLEVDEENLNVIHEISDKFQAIDELVSMTNSEKMYTIVKKSREIIEKNTGKSLSVNSEFIDIILDMVMFLKKICKDFKNIENKNFLKNLDEHFKRADSLLNRKIDEQESVEIGKILKSNLNLKDHEIDELLKLQKEKYTDLKLGEVAVRENVATPKEVINALKTQKSIKATEAVKAGQSKSISEGQEHENIRIPGHKADMLIDMLEELLVVESQINQEATKVFNQDSPFIKQMNTMSRIIKNIQNLSISFRMITLKTLFQKVKISVKDTAKKLDKKIELHIEGDETEIDRIIANKMLDPMLHLAKNSISHGIESEEERIKLGKNPEGKVKIEAYTDKGYVYIIISDDGQGVNIKKVYEKAKEKNLIDINKNYTDDEILNFIMLPGFSTAETVNAIAGRGVGMDVVKTEISKLGGKIEIENHPGEGCSFILRLPKNMTSLNGTVVNIYDNKYIIPTNYIKEIFKVEEDAYIHMKGKKNRIKLRDSIIPIVEMEKFFGENLKREDDRIMVVLDVDREIVAIPVKDIFERREIVVKPIGEEFQNIRHIYGASILGDGKAALILNIENLL